MKKFGCAIFLIICFCYVVVSAQTKYFESVKSAKREACLPADCYTLMSHNAGNFGKSKSSETIFEMTKLYQDVDLLVLQEVNTKQSGAKAVSRLADELNQTGSKWDYTVSDSTGGKATERYAFLWKTNRIYLKKNGKKINLFENLKDSITRVPGSAIFSLEKDEKDQSRFDLEIISIHLEPTAKHPEKEIKIILENGAEYFGKPDQIILGDFNLSFKKMEEVFRKETGFFHNIEGKTSLKMKMDTLALDYLSEEYDNIYTKGAIKVYQSGILDFVPFVKNYEEAKKISDHLPVFIIFSIK